LVLKSDGKTTTVLTHLTCASLTEDRYGVVQRDIPRILEALLSFLSAIEDYQAGIDAKYKLPADEELSGTGMSAKDIEARVLIRIEVVKAGEALSDLAGGMSLTSHILPTSSFRPYVGLSLACLYVTY
jgi:nucleoporin NDC1